MCLVQTLIYLSIFFSRFFSSLNHITQVETCQEKIITLELKDPITDATLSESQLLTPETHEPMTVSPSDDENSSIITVRSNDNDEHLAHLHFGASNSSAPQIQSAITATHHTHLAQCIDRSASIDTDGENANDAPAAAANSDHVMVSPLIAGDGDDVAQNEIIAVGRSNEDDSRGSSVLNDAVDASNDDYHSLAYNSGTDELSLSDRMKNVLQELVETERMKKLNVSESESDVDSVDGNEKSDTVKDDTDAENEPLQFDDIADELDRKPLMALDDDVDGGRGNEIAITTTSELNANRHQDSDGNNDDIKNANTFDDFVYENPNFLMAKDESDVNMSQQQRSANRNQRDIKLKEKLLSELNVQTTVQEGKHIDGTDNLNQLDNADDECSSLSLHEDISTSSADTSSRASNNNTNNGTSGKRKKRKNRGKK